MSAGRFDLSGKVAVVTGGAGIIGARIARGLAEHGAAVGIVDIDTERAEAVAAEIGAGVTAYHCDVSDGTSVVRMVDEVQATLGGIDVLFNNAAHKPKDLARFYEPLETFDIDVWREVMAVNVDGLFLVAQAVGRSMLERKCPGSIVQTASIYGLVGPDPRLYEGSVYRGHRIDTPPVYATAKAAVIGLTRYLATYWGKDQIRVNALVPGGVESGQNDTFRQRYGERTPLGRMADRDDMVGAAIFLASDASSYMTGQTLVVDGGFTAW